MGCIRENRKNLHDYCVCCQFSGIGFECNKESLINLGPSLINVKLKWDRIYVQRPRSLRRSRSPDWNLTTKQKCIRETIRKRENGELPDIRIAGVAG
jgi:hypothetical protein